MAKYAKVSLRIIDDYLKMLDKYTRLLVDKPSEENIRAFSIYSYEYMVIRNGFLKRYGDSREVYSNVELNASIIKSIIPDSNEHRRAFVMLKYYADTFRHIPVLVNGGLYLSVILESYSLYSDIFSILLPKESYVYKFLMNYDMVSKIHERATHKTNLRACKLYASRCLSVNNKTKESQCTVEETFKMLRKNFSCSKEEAFSVIYSVIKGSKKVDS